VSGPDGSTRPLLLVADDDPPSRVVLRQALEMGGFAVVEAGDGAEAVAIFGSERPALALIDVMMPRMDGFQATVAIRRLPGGDTVPIVILTGLDDVASIKKAYEAGATDFASKPMNLMVLAHRVRYMLRAKGALEELKESETRLAQAQRIARLGHWDLDLGTGALHWSQETLRLHGLDPLVGTPSPEAALATVHPADRAGVRRAREEAARTGRSYGIDFRVVLPDGGSRHLHEQAEVLAGPDGGRTRLSGTVQDVTDRREAEDQIRFLAYYDPLTRLPNRALFLERLSQALSGARRQKRPLAMMFLDVDRFKRINDTFGHAVGDRVLQEIADRLRRCLRSSDAITRVETLPPGEAVARLGGDEFIISLPEIARGEDAAFIARRILDSLVQPFRPDGREIFVTASLGVSLFPEDGGDAETLVRSADAAMYAVKESGRNGFRFYSRSMNTAAFKRLAIEGHLRRAVERGELRLHYQPQVDIRSGAILGAEALVRWQHPDLGLVPPVDFIPVAEDSGLILPIGEWILRTACAQARQWRDSGHPDLSLTVNLSGRQFREADLAGTVRRLVLEAGIDPRRLELELTESILMRNVEETLGALRALREMGLRISIDDFGTGYSSLSYLTRFPIDTLKIDRSFVRDLATDAGAGAITSAIITMAAGLHLTVIAEGVETPEQLQALRARGCGLAQGYLFSKPVPEEEFARLLRAQADGGRLFVAAG
jgi:diguanylate cyclase (GGDEF)-like protein/PAS domain S-box-containing protein